MGDLSAHFDRSEFRCHHCGKLVGPDPRLVLNLERARALGGGRPLRIVSGFRCDVHNRAVGGARRSQHLHGLAADLVPGAVTLAHALDAGFVGIGVDRNRAVIHVDMRPGAPLIFDDF